MLKAIAAYERRLVSHHSAFDRYAEALRTGDVAGQPVLSPAAQRGPKLFVGA
jgi:cytochrome c peroxidase